MKRTTAALALLVLAGCAGRHAADSEAILAEAGFQKTALVSSELKIVPERQLFSRQEAGGMTYEFVDQEFCQCRYVGGAKELATLQDLRKARRVEHERMRRSWSPYGSGDTATWGPWDPMGLDLPLP
jgi:hypothetical protein